MTSTVESDIVEINEGMADTAKLMASSLSTPKARKRALIDMMGINCAISYLQSKRLKIDTQKSIYKIPALYEEYKISDIYYRNYRIDVITLYKEKNIKIPKIHADMDILADFYFVVQVGAKIKEVKIIGFIEGKNIPSCSHDSKYYYPTLNLVKDFSVFANMIKHCAPLKTPYGKHTDCLGLFLKFMDNDLSSVYKRQLIQHLMSCDSCRSRFVDSVEFEKLSRNLKYYPALLREYETKASGVFIPKEPLSLEESLENAQVEQDFINIEEISEQNEENEKSEINQTPKTVQMFDLSEKSKKSLLNKAVIDSIFKDMPKFELQSLKSVVSAKNRRALIVCVVSLLIFASFIIISIKGSNAVEEVNEMAQLEEYNENSDYYTDDEGYTLADAPEGDIQNLANIENESMMQPVSTKPVYSPTVSKISFEAPGDIVDDAAYTKFLQLIGKTIKLNLQNDLLLVDDIPVNKKAKADIQITANGAVNSVKITYSSGSRTVDDTILKVINDTLSYMKPPKHGIIAKPLVITLCLDLN